MLFTVHGTPFSFNLAPSPICPSPPTHPPTFFCARWQVVLGRLEDKAALREVAAAFNCLASWGPNKHEVCEKAVCTMIGMLLNGDPTVERHAACGVAHLMESIELHTR